MNAEFLHKVLDAAEAISMPQWRRKDLQVKTKTDGSRVTKVDLEVESAIRAMLRQTYPQHSIFGEELATEKRSHSPYTWVIDPIDGTEAYITGSAMFSHMICLLKDRVPIASAIGFPAKKERYMGIDGRAYLHTHSEKNQKTPYIYRREIKIAETLLSRCTVHFTHTKMFTKEEFECVQTVADHSKGIVERGDSYNYCRLAAGDTIIVIECDLKPYDFFPLIPIVKGAGGVILDWRGDVLTFASSGRIVAGCVGAVTQAQVFLQVFCPKTDAAPAFIVT